MSFLNPVNETVLRFSSTDANAPQINYNARTAGDVKAVLKACLVTGYGAKASAGWSIVNEVDHVAEFVSPSAAMSDYRLGIDDTSTSSTTWYYQYQDVRANPIYNTPTKSIGNIVKTSAENGWRLLVTARAVILIEIFYVSVISAAASRVTYWGQIKSAINNTGKNIAFWQTGWSGGSYPTIFFERGSTSASLEVDSFSELNFSSANMPSLVVVGVNPIDQIELYAPLYLYKSGNLIAQHPAILTKTVNDSDLDFGVFEKTINNRLALSIYITRDSSNVSTVRTFAKVMLVTLDYWEF